MSMRRVMFLHNKEDLARALKNRVTKAEKLARKVWPNN